MESQEANPAVAAYLEGRILAMRSTDLIRLLFEIVLDEVTAARERLANGDIMGRSKSVSRAMAALHELTASLDEGKSPEYARRARAAYGYLLQQLSEAHAKKSDEIFAQVAQVVTAMLGNWVESCALLEAPNSESVRRGAYPGVEGQSGHSSGGWEA